MRPLEGMLIVTLEHAIAAPFCTRQLADLGARVIKVERPGEGDFARAYDSRAHGSASHFVWCNRSKESLTLDLKHPAARAVLQKLVERADVLVQNLAPGAAARMGLDHASLAPVNPRIVVCDISGYGDGGPYTAKKAYDLLIQSEAGFVSVTGTPETPSKAGLSIADIAAGMYAYSSVLAALLERGRTGRGQRLEISMLEAMSEWMGFPLYYTLDGQPPPLRAGASHAAIYPYGPFTCGDGKQVVLAVQHDREWATFCNQVLQLPELTAQYLGNANRLAQREKLRGIIEGVCATLTRRNWWRGWMRRKSPTASSTRWPTCGSTRNSRRVGAGPRSVRQAARCRRCTRRTTSRAASRRRPWGRCLRWVSTPKPS